MGNLLVHLTLGLRALKKCQLMMLICFSGSMFIFLYFFLQNQSLERNIQIVRLQSPHSQPIPDNSANSDNSDNNPSSGTGSRRYLTVYPLDGSAGRLGNFCFRYAAARGIALSNNMELVLPDTQLLKKMKAYFNLQTKSTSAIESWDRLSFTNVSEEHWGIYSRKIAKTLPGHTNVRLNWMYTQSWKYFYSVSELIREELSLNRSLSYQSTEAISNLKLRYGVNIVVGLHVRRGDFLRKAFQSWGYAVAPKEYFTLATRWFINKYGENILFVVTAEPGDMAWCYENLDFNGTLAYFSTNQSAIEDFALLIACDHHIVSVGSFGWWAAWLGNKLGDIIYYKLWPRPGSNHAKNHSPTDYYPPEWIPLP